MVSLGEPFKYWTFLGHKDIFIQFSDHHLTTRHFWTIWIPDLSGIQMVCTMKKLKKPLHVRQILTSFKDWVKESGKKFVVWCCTLNKTWYCDEHLFDKLAQTQVVINWRDTAAQSVHQWRFRLPRFSRMIFGDVMIYNSLTTSCTLNPRYATCLWLTKVDFLLYPALVAWW